MPALRHRGWPRRAMRSRSAGGAAPGTPTGLAVSNETSSTVDLDWDAVSGADGYRIYQDSVLIDDVATNATYTVTGLDPSTSYDFQVSAYNGDGESALSSVVVGTTVSTLLDGLVSSWPLSADGSDEVGGNTLTNNNGVTFVAKGVGAPANLPDTVANFVAASGQFFSVADNATTVWGEDGNGLTVALWANLSAGTSFSSVFTRQNAGSPGFHLYTDSGSVAHINGLTYASGAVSAAIGYSTNWHLILAWFDPTDKKMHISVDDTGEVASSAATSAALDASTEEVRIGSWGSGQLEGQVSQPMVWSRVLTSDERDELWNGGDANPYPFVSS